MAQGVQILLCVLSFYLPFANGQTASVNCDITSIRIPDSNIKGGVEAADGRNVSSCEAICTASNSCNGFDFDRLQNRCFLTQDPSANIYYDNSPGVDHYILMKSSNNCIGSCSYPSWVPLVNTHSSGAEGYKTNGLDECVSLCIGNASCLSFDWDTSNADGFNCWIQTNPSSTADANGIYHYAKNCSPMPESSTTTNARTTTLPLPISYMPSSLSLSSTLTTTTTKTTTTTTATSASIAASATNLLAFGSSLTMANSMPTVLSTTRTTRLVVADSSASFSSSSSSSSSSSPVISGTSLLSPMMTYAASTPLSFPTTMSSSQISGTPPSDTNDPEPNSKYSEEDTDYGSVDWAIKPTYVILAGMGGGCLLLVLTAIVILCEHPLNAGSEKGYPFLDGTMDSSSENVIDMSIFDTHANPDFPLYGILATEFVATAVR